MQVLSLHPKVQKLPEWSPNFFAFLYDQDSLPFSWFGPPVLMFEMIEKYSMKFKNLKRNC